MIIGQLEAGLATDVGLRRRSNQDLGIAEQGVFMVCDGMGGGMGGERASALAVRHLRALSALRDRRRGDIERTLAAAQADVVALGEELGGVAGTTVTGVVLAHNDDAYAGPRTGTAAATAPSDGHPVDFDDTMSTPIDGYDSLAYVVNVGDSRTYHMDALPDGSAWDASTLTRITRDHSQRQEAIDSGEMLPDVAKALIPRNVITQCIGDPEGIAPDLYVADATGRFIVCSDGLHAEVAGDETIASIAAAHNDPRQAAEALVKAALEAGGSDNVTVVVVDMPMNEPERHGWAVTRLGDDEDIGEIADETLQTLRTITTRRP
ncbi:PP2C family protein-serine/threonine phosphatase [Bifidobacterium saguinibicoloris]|uniref:PP2C family protein-serine/threonine phosphatase n=1 Tax=Bifidobacterium saguinibicoloris TaxID=2834433 RepID=UPI001C598454|nr:serine/threonine-protein phosphatase [Bifidobacterium saguinibicoloris]MBW3081420.1 serine/threonine-protein phosphatase [Bifidobacterium saguinibicoloris]